MSQLKGRRKRRNLLNWSPERKLKRLRVQKKLWARRDRAKKRKEKRAQKKAEKAQRKALKIARAAEARAQAAAQREEKRKRREEILSLMSYAEKVILLRRLLQECCIRTKASDAYQRGLQEGYAMAQAVSRGTIDDGTSNKRE